ncbi:MAG: flavin reductase [Treponema sp.]|uniref:flavin reductase family protein n=1 Tax=Treponema sp. TaxID=166 RepID=UPI00257ADD8B|nr:flavin reductase [Treponema sp.]MBQ5537933.1 flavin reductase [Treponema sp.]
MAFTENFAEVALEKAYELLSGAKTIMVCTKGAKDGQYNVTPYGWFTTYDYEPVSKMLFVSDPSHQAAANVLRTKEFAVCVPKDEDDPLIAQAGSVSSPDADKFALFSIKGERATKIDAKVIPGMSRAIIEFKLARVVEEGSVKIFMGEAVAAWKKA